MPLLAAAALFVFLRNRQPAYEHELEGYALTLKAEAIGELVYASLAVLKVRGDGNAPAGTIQVIFRTPGGESSPRFSRNPPRERREVEIIATVFQASAASEVTAEVTVGARSLVLSSEVRRGAP